MTDVIAGRFALCDPIARGGSGVVWRAWDRRTKQFCAAKVLRRRDAGDLLRFVREQSVRMSHEHVLTPYSWAAEDSHVVIASELIDGGSLNTLLSDYGPLAEGTIAAVLNQLLLALEQVHAVGLIHRDVKPGNLMLRATGTGPLRILLGDFGVAIGHRDAHLTEIGHAVGTPGYMSPEILRGAAVPEPRHDIFAAGRLATALALGVEPRELGVPTDLSGLRPGPLRDAVAAFAADSPMHRPPTARDARAMLRAVAVDAVPRTRDGDPVEVLNQLPPLSDLALGEQDARDAITLATARVAPQTPRLVAATPPPVEEQAAATPPVGEQAAATPPAPGTADESRPGNRRLPVLLGIAGLAVAAGVTVPLVLSGSSSGSGGAPGRSSSPAAPAPSVGRTSPTAGRTSASTGTGASTRPPTTPSGGTSSSGGTFAPSDVALGQACAFTDEGDARTTASGVSVRCVKQSNGSYVWVRS